MGDNVVRRWRPNGNATTATSDGLTAIAMGTATAVNVASDTLYNSIAKLGYAGSTAGLRHNLAQFFRGNPSGAGAPGGFEVVHRFGFATIQNDCRGFCGLFNSGSGIGTAANPSAFLNVLGVGFDTADTTLQVYSNDGSGAATKINLGSDFPCGATAAATDFYVLHIYCAPRADRARVAVRNLRNDAFAEVEITSDLPTIGFLMGEQLWLAAGTGTVQLDIAGRYVETDL